MIHMLSWRFENRPRTNRLPDIKIEKNTERKTERHTDRQTDRDRQRQTGRQWNFSWQIVKTVWWAWTIVTSHIVIRTCCTDMDHLNRLFTSSDPKLELWGAFVFVLCIWDLGLTGSWVSAGRLCGTGFQQAAYMWGICICSLYLSSAPQEELSFGWPRK